MTIGDSLRLVFSAGHGGLRVRLGRSGDRWAGIGHTFEDLEPVEVYARPIDGRTDRGVPEPDHQPCSDEAAERQGRRRFAGPPLVES